jgi:large subunit ribosomal protein L21
MFAVVKIGTSQYLVNPGQEVLIDFQAKAGSKITFDQVLLLSDDEKITVGKPLVEKAVVTADVLGHPKGEKISVGKFKAKSRYHKFIGFRPHYTRIKITDISLGGIPKASEITPVVKTPAVRAKRTKKVS